MDSSRMIRIRARSLKVATFGDCSCLLQVFLSQLQDHSKSQINCELELRNGERCSTIN